MSKWSVYFLLKEFYFLDHEQNRFISNRCRTKQSAHSSIDYTKAMEHQCLVRVRRYDAFRHWSNEKQFCAWRNSYIWNHNLRLWVTAKSFDVTQIHVHFERLVIRIWIFLVKSRSIDWTIQTIRFNIISSVIKNCWIFLWQWVKNNSFNVTQCSKPFLQPFVSINQWEYFSFISHSKNLLCFGIRVCLH